MVITILTPTYNRGYTLERLYNSLMRQTKKEFEWLIVDDGSEDDTKQLVQGYIDQRVIPIRYIYQNNGGKHRAINTGIKNITNPLTFIVDSDDYLLDNAIEEILKVYDKYSSDKSICGFSFLRCFPDLSINGPKFMENEYISDYISCRLNEKIKGDKAEVYRTECLREFPFLEVVGEKFLFEDYVWIQMAEKYKTVHYNIPIYVGDYLSDGLTRNISKVKYKSPIGMMERGRIMCSRNCILSARFKGMIHYIAYGTLAKKKLYELFSRIPYKALFVLSVLPGIVYYIKIEMENR